MIHGNSLTLDWIGFSSMMMIQSLFTGEHDSTALYTTCLCLIFSIEVNKVPYIKFHILYS